MSPPNLGSRRKLTLEGERYYLTVTNGPDGPAVELTCAHDVPPHSRTRKIAETLCGTINDMFGGDHAA